jgi:hypothetical protein
LSAGIRRRRDGPAAMTAALRRKYNVPIPIPRAQ